MASVERTYIDAIRTALTSAGFTVFNSILDRHTGFRTRNRSYVELGRGWNRTMDEITTDCISGPYSFRIRYYQHKQLVTNSSGEVQTFEDNCQTLEAAISQVKTKGLYTKPNISIVEGVASNLQGLVRDYELSGTVASAQNRSDS